jgi:hypothetical protein
MEVSRQVHDLLKHFGQAKNVVPARNRTITPWLSSPEPSYYRQNKKTNTYMCIVMSAIVRVRCFVQICPGVCTPLSEMGCGRT